MATNDELLREVERLTTILGTVNEAGFNRFWAAEMIMQRNALEADISRLQYERQLQDAKRAELEAEVSQLKADLANQTEHRMTAEKWLAERNAEVSCLTKHLDAYRKRRERDEARGK